MSRRSGACLYDSPTDAAAGLTLHTLSGGTLAQSWKNLEHVSVFDARTGERL